jgi:competence protein ComEC
MLAEAPKRRALWVAAFFGSGITLAHLGLHLPPFLWFGAALVLLAAGIAARHRLAQPLFAAATIALGGGWYALRVETSAIDHISRRLTDQPSLIRVEGMIVTSPRVIADRSGRLGRFFAASPRTHFELRAEQQFDDAGNATPVSGRLWIGVDGDSKDWRIGDRVRASGMARAIAPPTNPGQSDGRLWASARGVGGRLDIDAPGAMTFALTPPTPVDNFEAKARRFVETMRANARAWIDSDRSNADDRQPRALLRALLLGLHDRDMGELDEAFMRLGLTHILSISGLNLAILAATVLYLLRFIGDRPRIEALIAAIAISGYLLVIPVRAPVARSAIMVFALLAAETSGRRYDRLTILGWTMVIVLLIQPLELFSPGFQLSFGVVAALLTLTRPVRERLFGEKPQRDTHGPVRAVSEFIKDAAASSIVAWAVASPLVAYHVGVFSPLGAIATLLLMPLVAFIMGVGYVSLLIALVIPAVGHWAAPPLVFAADWMTRLVFMLDAAPGTVLHLPRVSLAWTTLATAVAIWWLRPGGPTGIEGYSRGARIGRWACTIGACAWLAVTLVAPSLTSREHARLDTLDVSDGACHLLRVKPGLWNEEAILYDCGSLRLTIGERTIPSAIRALGGWRVPTVILSHPNIDHYSGLLDIIQPLGVRRVVIGECFEKAARAAPDGPAAFLLAELRRMKIEIRIAAQGDTIEVARAKIDILSPPRNSTWKLDNDASIVCRVTLPESPTSILLCGDIQRDAIIDLRERHPDLRATILEAPHHGSYNEASREFVAAIDPPFVIQSTGPRRLNDPRWKSIRESRHKGGWFTTAAHGAVSLSIDAEGKISAQSWRRP